MTGRTARGEKQPQVLARIVYELIAQGGFERLRTRDVAARAGINIATLHYYFPAFDMVRIEDGKIVEHWFTGEFPGMLRQLGAMP